MLQFSIGMPFENSSGCVARPRSFERGVVISWLVPSLLVLFAGLSAGGLSAADTTAIKTLTAERAEQLVAEHKGPLDLAGLSELPIDVAAVLAGYDGDLLLDGLLSLSPQAAEALASHAGSAGKAVDPEAIAARVSEAFEQGDLRLSRFEEIVTEFGGEGSIPALSLGGLIALKPDVAAALAGHTGDLRLDGLKSLSAEAAAALATHVGSLSLSGIDGLDADVAEALAPHMGDVFIPDAVLERVTAELQPPATPVSPDGAEPGSNEDIDPAAE
jgi:hypothetical protein